MILFRKIKVLKKIISICLIAIITFPNLTQIEHLFDSHNHQDVCTISLEHLHSTPDDCNLCDHIVPNNQIYFSNKQVKKNNYYILSEFSTKTIITYVENLNLNLNLRAPPVFDY